MGKKPTILDHCCTAGWTKGLSTTLSLNLSYFIEYTLHILFTYFRTKC